uniref:Ras-related protein Rab-30 n=1 Tax=Timema douglasi TaxID=61478 RepID=A0A7R8Z6N9_TIMDO|nr:unnamed protein product [Timema douglasi]
MLETSTTFTYDAATSISAFTKRSMTLDKMASCALEVDELGAPDQRCLYGNVQESPSLTRYPQSPVVASLQRLFPPLVGSSVVGRLVPTQTHVTVAVLSVEVGRGRSQSCSLHVDNRHVTRPHPPRQYGEPDEINQIFPSVADLDLWLRPVKFHCVQFTANFNADGRTTKDTFVPFAVDVQLTSRSSNANSKNIYATISAPEPVATVKGSIKIQISHWSRNKPVCDAVQNKVPVPLVEGAQDRVAIIKGDPALDIALEADLPRVVPRHHDDGGVAVEADLPRDTVDVDGPHRVLKDVLQKLGVGRGQLPVPHQHGGVRDARRHVPVLNVSIKVGSVLERGPPSVDGEVGRAADFRAMIRYARGHHAHLWRARRRRRAPMLPGLPAWLGHVPMWGRGFGGRCHGAERGYTRSGLLSTREPFVYVAKPHVRGPEPSPPPALLPGLFALQLVSALRLLQLRHFIHADHLRARAVRNIKPCPSEVAQSKGLSHNRLEGSKLAMRGGIIVQKRSFRKGGRKLIKGDKQNIVLTMKRRTKFTLYTAATAQRGPYARTILSTTRVQAEYEPRASTIYDAISRVSPEPGPRLAQAILCPYSEDISTTWRIDDRDSCFPDRPHALLVLSPYSRRLTSSAFIIQWYGHVMRVENDGDEVCRRKTTRKSVQVRRKSDNSRHGRTLTDLLNEEVVLVKREGPVLQLLLCVGHDHVEVERAVDSVNIHEVWPWPHVRVHLGERGQGSVQRPSALTGRSRRPSRSNTGWGSPSNAGSCSGDTDSDLVLRMCDREGRSLNWPKGRGDLYVSGLSSLYLAQPRGSSSMRGFISISVSSDSGGGWSARSKEALFLPGEPACSRSGPLPRPPRLRGAPAPNKASARIQRKSFRMSYKVINGQYISSLENGGTTCEFSLSSNEAQWLNDLERRIEGQGLYTYQETVGLQVHYYVIFKVRQSSSSAEEKYILLEEIKYNKLYQYAYNLEFNKRGLQVLRCLQINEKPVLKKSSLTMAEGGVVIVTSAWNAPRRGSFCGGPPWRRSTSPVDDVMDKSGLLELARSRLGRLYHFNTIKNKISSFIVFIGVGRRRLPTRQPGVAGTDSGLSCGGRRNRFLPLPLGRNDRGCMADGQFKIKKSTPACNVWLELYYLPKSGERGKTSCRRVYLHFPRGVQISRLFLELPLLLLQLGLCPQQFVLQLLLLHLQSLSRTVHLVTNRYIIPLVAQIGLLTCMNLGFTSIVPVGRAVIGQAGSMELTRTSSAYSFLGGNTSFQMFMKIVAVKLLFLKAWEVSQLFLEVHLYWHGGRVADLFGENTISTRNLDAHLNSTVIGSQVYCESRGPRSWLLSLLNSSTKMSFHSLDDCWSMIYIFLGKYCQHIDKWLAVDVVLVGNAGVGKTCLVRRFTQGLFPPGQGATIGVDFMIKTVEIDNEKVKIWDTAGQERFRSITQSYYRSAHALILVYDISCQPTFDCLPDWLREIEEYASNKVLRVLRHSMYYLETSAKEAENVEKLFMEIAAELMEQARSKELPRYDTNSPTLNGKTTVIGDNGCCGGRLS